MYTEDGYGQYVSTQVVIKMGKRRGKSGKKWGRYRSGGRSKPVECIYCGGLVPRQKAVPVTRGFRVDRKIPGIDRRRVFTSASKSYACISCAKHRGLI
jgi:ribosomal protein S26